MNTHTPITQNRIGRALATAALIVGIAAGAHAGDVPQVHVNFADLNVNTPAGVAVLFQRIRGAATQVCTVPGMRDLEMLAVTRACAAHAVADAVAQVNNPLLTGLYEIKTGVAPALRLAAR
jgi:UrcA family protein